MSTEDTLALARPVFNWVRLLFPDCGLESLTDDPAETELSFSVLNGTPIVARYKDGSYIARFRFAIYERIPAADTASRLSAFDDLSEVCETLGSSTDSLVLPSGFEMDDFSLESLPARVGEEEQYEDYLVTFALEYKRG